MISMACFDDDENFFRNVPNYPNMYKDNGKITSAVFLSKRCSVDKQGDRSKTEVCSVFKKRFPKSKDAVSVTYLECTENEVFVKSTPSTSNKYHCELWENENIDYLSKRKARLLSRIAIVHNYK